MKTVRELKQFIETLPADTPVRILDADTLWTLEVTNIFVDNDGLILSGDYTDVVN